MFVTILFSDANGFHVSMDEFLQLAVLEKMQNIMKGGELGKKSRLKYDGLTMPEYNGGDDVREWLERYERQSSLLGWNRTKRLAGLPMFFGKKVRTSYDHALRLRSEAKEKWGSDFEEGKVEGLPEGCNPSTFEGMKQFLLKEYTPKNVVGSSIKVLTKIKQMPNEKVKPFYWKMVEQVERVNRAFESEGKTNYVTSSGEYLASLFIKGLRDKEMRRKVREGKPATIVAARSLAEEFESIFSDDDSDSEEESRAAALVEPSRRIEEKISRHLREWRSKKEKSKKKKNKRKKSARKKETILITESSSDSSSENEKSDQGDNRAFTRSQAGSNGRGGKGSSSSSSMSAMTLDERKEMQGRLERNEEEMRELREQLKAREQMSVFADRLSRVEGEKQALAAMLQSKTVMHPERVSALNSQTNKRPHPTRGGKTRTCYRCGNPNHLSFECKRQVSCTNCGRGNHMTQACRFQNGQKETRCNTCGRYGHSEETCFSNGYQRPLKFPRRDDNGWRTRNARGMGTNAPQQQNFQLRQGFQQQQNWQQQQNFQPTSQQGVRVNTQLVPQAAFTSLQQNAVPVAMLENQSFVQMPSARQTPQVLVPAHSFLGGNGQSTGVATQPVTSASTIALEQKLEKLAKQVETLQGNNLNRLGQ
jgi:hypothetical protein